MCHGGEGVGAAFFHHGPPPVAAGDILSLTDPPRILTALIGPPPLRDPELAVWTEAPRVAALG